MPVNISQYCGTLRIFNNRNYFVQSKFSYFTCLRDNNNNNNNNNNLANGPLILLNKRGFVLLLLNVMFVFEGNESKNKNIIFV